MNSINPQLASEADLAHKAQHLRHVIFKTICDGGGGHIPSCLSIAEILAVLYYHVLQIDPAQVDDPGRDRFILSKGHAGVALYAVLADLGFFDAKLLATYGQAETLLGGHPDMHKLPGVEASTGALGHGLAFGMGHALAAKLDGKTYRTFVLLGDGECQEGSVWEAALFAAQRRLDNLIAVIDYNKLQALDRLDNIVSLEPLADKWRAFGWQVREVDGHDVSQLLDAFDNLPFTAGQPSLIIAHTVKGKHSHRDDTPNYMENVPIWHYRLPDPEQMFTSCTQLGTPTSLYPNALSTACEITSASTYVSPEWRIDPPGSQQNKRK